MKRNGSITIFFTLVLAVMISLLSGLLLSAKVSAGRVQIANSVDMTLFSAMAKYDRALFEEYHLFYIDGGYGTETLQLGKALDEIEKDLLYMTTPNKEKEWMGGKNFLHLEKKSGSIVGYTLATDCDGGVFWEQVLSYMEDTLSLQGISLLTQNVEEVKSKLTDFDNTHKKVTEKGTIEDYENVKEAAKEKQEEISKNDDANIEETEDEQVTELVSPQDRESAMRAKDALDAISLFQKHSLLHLVTGDVSGVSNWSTTRMDAFRSRTIDTGMGYLELVREKETVLDDLLFQEYMMQNLNSYTNSIHETGPQYGLERILFQKDSDIENLEMMVEKLMLLREASNVAYLYADPNRLAEIRTMAVSLAAVLGVPGVELILEGAIALAWSYAESVVDVYQLMSGEKVPLVKTGESWQVGFSEIIFALQNPANYKKDVGTMSYDDYLRIFLMSKSRRDQIAGCMEVIELSMREIPGKEAFAMDKAIDSLEVEFVFRVERFIDCVITEKRSYRTM